MSEYIKWVSHEKGKSVEGAIAGGDEEGATIYVARVRFNGGVHPGKYVIHSGTRLVDAGYTGYDGKEIKFYDFQVATGDESNFKWVAQSGPFNKFNVLASGGIPVQAGFYINGYEASPFYIARAAVSNRGKHIGIICGKVSEGSAALVPYGVREHICIEYEVLVYTGPSLEPPQLPSETPSSSSDPRGYY